MALKDFERFTSSDDDIIYHHTKSRITIFREAVVEEQASLFTSINYICNMFFNCHKCLSNLIITLKSADKI